MWPQLFTFTFTFTVHELLHTMNLGRATGVFPYQCCLAGRYAPAVLPPTPQRALTASTAPPVTLWTSALAALLRRALSLYTGLLLHGESDTCPTLTITRESNIIRHSYGCAGTQGCADRWPLMMWPACSCAVVCVGVCRSRR